MSWGKGFVPNKEVRLTPELGRIAALPRRQWTEQTARSLVPLLSPLLRTPTGTMELRPLQAQALHDAGVSGGLLAPIRVGGGKTLISLLIGYVMQAKRILLIVPASLVVKTKREMQTLASHWRIPYQRIRIISYELLGRDQAKDTLNNFQPDVIVCDEVHRLKNPKAAVTRRVARHMHTFPSTRFVGMSGTITKRSLKDYAHIVKWCLPESPPIPRGYTELEEWCSALDEKTNPFALLLHPGAILRELASEEDEDDDPTAMARKAYRRRLGETQGVVATTEGYSGSSLYIDTLPIVGNTRPELDRAFADLRDRALDPDGILQADGMSVWRKARELALGMYYRWNPRPPESWLIIRQAWAKFVRKTITNLGSHRAIDTEFQVAKAIRDGSLDDEDEIHRMWREIEPTFSPVTEAVWIDDHALIVAHDWLAKHPKGICWVEHTEFGRQLAILSGLPFYQNGGKDSRGLLIDDPATPMSACIASMASNSTGRNLQRWCDNLLMSPPPNGAQWEQLLGRTDRDGQTADEVTVSIYQGCIEHFEAIERAMADARYIEDSTGQAQKLLYADLTLPSTSDMLSSTSRRYRR